MIKPLAAFLLLCSAALSDEVSDTNALLDPDQATAVVVQSGPASDPATFGGAVPGDGAKVHVPNGVTLTIDGVTPRWCWLRDDGLVDFRHDVDTVLSVDTVLVGQDGMWSQGDAAEPVAADKTSRVVFVDDSQFSDPRQLSLGFISLGHTYIYGQRKAEAVPCLPAAAGSNALMIAAMPTGWRVGDVVVVAGCLYGQDEVRTLTDVTDTSVTLNEPLVFDHVPPDASLTFHVANLTRNVRFESADTSVLATRGHCMVMHQPTHHVEGAAFIGLGRTDKSRVLNNFVVNADGSITPGTNQVGRYPLHIHRTGVQDGAQTAYVGYCAVQGPSPGWSLAQHSSKAVIEHCAMFDVFGAHLVSEAGNEVGTWRNNVAIKTGGTGFIRPDAERFPKFSDHAHSGHGYWLTGGGVEMIDNTAAGCKFAGVTVVSMGLKENGVETKFDRHNLRDPGITTEQKIVVERVPFSISGQRSYGCGHGADVWLTRLFNGRSLMKDLTAWNCSLDAHFISYCNHVDIDHPVLINAPGVSAAGSNENDGISGSGASANVGGTDLVYTQPRIIGFRTGISISLATGPKAEIRGGYFDNEVNIRLLEKINPDDGGRITVIDNPTFTSGAQWNVFLEEDWQPPPSKYFAKYLWTPDTLTINGQRAYWQVQHPDFVPFPVNAVPGGTPSEYVGLTNQQLSDQYGRKLYGAVFAGPLLPGTNAMVETLPPPPTCEEQLEAARQEIARLLERVKQLEQ